MADVKTMLEMALVDVESDLRERYSNLLVRYGVLESDRHDRPPAIVFRDDRENTYEPARQVGRKPSRQLARRNLGVVAEIWGTSKANAEALLAELIGSLQSLKPGAFTLESDVAPEDQDTRQAGYTILLSFRTVVGVLARERQSVILNATELLPVQSVPGDGNLDATE